MPGRSMDGYGSDDMAIPELKLIQNVGGDWAKDQGAKPGDLFLTLTDEVIKGEEGLDISVVDIKKQRTFWGRSDIEDAPPECSSQDLVIGSDGAECAKCDRRSDQPWLVDATERRKKCLLDYNMVCIAKRMPVMIRAGGISSNPVRELMTQLRLNRELKGQYQRAIIHVTSSKKKTAAGDAYALHFRVTGIIEDKQALEENDRFAAELLGTVYEKPEPIKEAQPQKQIETKKEEVKQEEPPVEEPPLDLNF